MGVKEMPEPKMFYQSKTVIFNVLFVLVALAGVLGSSDFKPSPELAEGTAILMAAANLVLRIWFTDKPVTLTKPKGDGSET